MSVTVINDNFVHYEVFGRGKPVIFLHGWLGSWRYWWPSMQALSKHHRTFAFDLWGFGDSGKVTSEYSFEAYLDMLEQFVERLGIQGALTLIGHDVGAAIALRFARLNPQLVERVVAVSLPVNSNAINHNLSNGKTESFVNRYLSKSAAFPELEQEAGKHDLSAISAVASQLMLYDCTLDLEQATCQVLLVFGDRDAIIKAPENGAVPQAFLDDSLHVVTLEGCNHFPMLEETAVFNRLIEDFIHNQEQVTIAPKDYWQRRTR